MRTVSHKRLGECVVLGTETIDGIVYIKLISTKTAKPLRVYVAVDKAQAILEAK